MAITTGEKEVADAKRDLQQFILKVQKIEHYIERLYKQV